MEKIVSALIADGWKEYRDALRFPARCFYKSFDTPTHCNCNDNSGMQVCCAVSEFNGRASYEFDLCAGLPDGSWVKLQQYIMPEDITQGLAMIPRMLSSWEHIANFR